MDGRIHPNEWVLVTFSWPQESNKPLPDQERTWAEPGFRKFDEGVGKPYVCTYLLLFFSTVLCSPEWPQTRHLTEDNLYFQPLRPPPPHRITGLHHRMALHLAGLQACRITGLCHRMVLRLAGLQACTTMWPCASLSTNLQFLSWELHALTPSQRRNSLSHGSTRTWANFLTWFSMMRKKGEATWSSSSNN